ncbi:MAG: MMPL family transporter [Candidatus Poseidoniaceae archaeon]|nr:MMPL family transporter [Candidatus Poseidoniaceae archaeon]
MQNPFTWMSKASVQSPKRAFGIVIVIVLLLSSGAMHLQFDNSEDGFFPDDENVDLLNQLESEYQASVDFVRTIRDVEEGDLLLNSTWSELAEIEAMMLENEDFKPLHYPLFGTQANSGMAGYALQWQMWQDVESGTWIPAFQSALLDIQMANSSQLPSALENLTTASQSLPEVSELTPEQLRAWSPQNPSDWLSRIDEGSNLSSEIGALIGQLNGLTANRDPAEIGQIMAVTGPLTGHLIPLSVLQDIDYREAMLSCIPVGQREDPWNMSGPVLTTLVISTEPADYGHSILDDVQSDIGDWSQSMLDDMAVTTGNEDLRTFSFAQFALGANGSLGKEIGILTSAAMLLLAGILWLNFRSVRDTAYVTFLTIISIAATYGIAGWLQFMGVNMVFNAAMNSIPVLLLAIGVDYGLHVVLRIREEMQNIDAEDSIERQTLADFSYEARMVAVQRGTVLTSIALVIAIFTDMVGFLSFRFSALSFLQVFGTVIAIGLFAVYLLSITALPALMLMFPPKKLALSKASNISIGKISLALGRLSTQPVKVGFIAVLLLTPMYFGFQQLEVGFDQRDQFDQDIPVVSDFLMLSDDFQSSRSPLYLVVDVDDAVTHEGRLAWDAAYTMLTESDDVSGTPNGLWNLLSEAQIRDTVLNDLMVSLDANSPETYDALSAYVLENETGRQLTAAVLASNGQQTVLSFQAETLDWQATIDLYDRLTAAAQGTEDAIESDATLRIGGRSLIVAQTTSDVAESAVLSTSVVAFVILGMLVGIHTTRQKNIKQGLARGFVSWIPLMMVVGWVYGIMGYTGYQINAQTVTIGALSLGLGVDYAVHFSVRLEEEVERFPTHSQEVWVTNASATTGRAMFAAALTTAGGFSVLNLSALLPLQLFGQAFVVAITLALLSSLILLPAFYTPFLKQDAKRFALEHTEAE